jgi:hypothetical protein
MGKADESFEKWLRLEYVFTDGFKEWTISDVESAFLAAHAAQQVTIDEQAGEIIALRLAIESLLNFQGVIHNSGGAGAGAVIQAYETLARTALMAGEER